MYIRLNIIRRTSGTKNEIAEKESADGLDIYPVSILDSGLCWAFRCVDDRSAKEEPKRWTRHCVAGPSPERSDRRGELRGFFNVARLSNGPEKDQAVGDYLMQDLAGGTVHGD